MAVVFGRVGYGEASLAGYPGEGGMAVPRQAVDFDGEQSTTCAIQSFTGRKSCKGWVA